MVQNLYSLVRLAGMAATALVVVAVGIGSLVPDTRSRAIGQAPLVGVSPSTARRGDDPDVLRVLDVRAGTIRPLALDPDDRVDLAVGSPWVDAWGCPQLVGRWARVGSQGDLLETGIARLSYPSGRVIDRIALERYPIAPPCWGSGTSDRILYVSGDGALYRLDLEPGPGAPALDGQPGLCRIRWGEDACDGPAPYLFDVCRAGVGLPEGLMLASAAPRGLEPVRNGGQPSQIWWLRLGPDEDEVVAAGPVGPVDSEGDDLGRRRPCLGRRADGTLRLAYLSSSGVADRMRLRVAPARVDERTGAPRVDATSGVVVAEDCMNITPSFTGDATALTVLSHGTPTPEARLIALDPPPSPTALAAADDPAGAGSGLH